MIINLLPPSSAVSVSANYSTHVLYHSYDKIHEKIRHCHFILFLSSCFYQLTFFIVFLDNLYRAVYETNARIYSLVSKVMLLH
jgi:hypothetical protein